ncbi:hypothetical protein [Actinacidiphila rubida]|uniref:Uncharacterized protein n=1 Tax=Actinacidiphila rubida TaxID=310780 RepID=A0A1H8FDG3_9ACTN|nr:hypothetical protein [Actinacidiphila rubida]SEN29749.1 hypothetical protein SAMN05216267_1003263 [Actinacidiphila rubida]
MADHRPELVDDALRALGATHTELREAHKRWQARLHSRSFPGGEMRYLTTLGRPESQARRQVGDLACKAVLWPLPLWPTLRFEILVAPGGAVWNEWLVREPGNPGPDLAALPSVAELPPWGCTVEEVLRGFTSAVPLVADAPSRARVGVTDPRSGDAFTVHFTWGLCQFVAPRP